MNSRPPNFQLPDLVTKTELGQTFLWFEFFYESDWHLILSPESSWDNNHYCVYFRKTLKMMESEQKFILSFKNHHFKRVLSFTKVNTVVIIVSALLSTHVCYTSLYSEPASSLSLLTVWSHRGIPGVTMCQEMATSPAGYIPQHKVPSASSSRSLDFFVCLQCCRMINSVPIEHTISIL